ncbi:MAG: 3-deoxy-D-manno-octulosonic acid transferase [Gammaproteobacteria bacterium]|nr:3-deoxy-D-manno-octulosonic acid transferase [Gammaproteobacteria bacterium]
MFNYLYNFLLILFLPLMLLRLYLRGARVPGYRQRIGERFGRFNPPAEFNKHEKSIWIHAVSVGETVAAEPLVRLISETYPKTQLLITSTTPAGSDRVKDLFGNSVLHSYLPYDLSVLVNCFLNRVNPCLLIVMETELWPNLIYQCRKRGVKILLANARLSERSAVRYSRIPATTKTMLQSINAIAAQSEADGKRLETLGANAQQVTITGNLKFNVRQSLISSIEDPFFNAIKKLGRTIIIAASTREGEEKILLNTIIEILSDNPNVLFLVVPRHPERSNQVCEIFGKAGLVTLRRTQWPSITEELQVIVGDSMGEMDAYYSMASIAFVGGSLVDTGCQNVLEPAAHSLPVLVGPSQFNFEQICNQLEKEGGLQTVATQKELSRALVELLTNTGKRQRMGAAARSVIDSNQQALRGVMELVNRLLK